MSEKAKLKAQLQKSVSGLGNDVLDQGAQAALESRKNSIETQAGGIANEINGGVQSLTQKFDKFQNKLNNTTTEGLITDGAQSLENMTHEMVNEQISKITGSFGSKVEVQFVLDSDGIAYPDTSSLDNTGGVTGTVAQVLQLITGLGTSAAAAAGDLKGQLQKAVTDASPEGLLAKGKELEGKIGAFSATTINSLATDAVSSVTDELETLVGSITDINRTITGLPSSIENDDTDPNFGEYTTTTFDQTNSFSKTSYMPEGDTEFFNMLNNVKTNPLQSLSEVVNKDKEIKQNLTSAGAIDDFSKLSGGKPGLSVLTAAQEQQNLRNQYQALANERNSLIQSRVAGDGSNGIIQELSTETLTDLKKQVKKFAPKLTDKDITRVINLSQGNSQEFSQAVELLFQATGKPASEIRAFLKTIDTTITKATAPELENEVFDEPYVIGSFEKSWRDGEGDPVFPYISSVEELQAELRNIKREVTEVVVHWTETPTNKNIGSEEINEQHLEAKLNGIGYHYVIRRDGSLQRGRPANKEGEHAVANDHNKRSLAVVFVGGINAPSETRNIQDFLSVQSLTRSQFNTFDHFCRAFYDVFAGGQIVGHSDIDELANDPGFDVRAYVKANFDKDSKFTSPLKQSPFTIDEINS